MGNSGFEPPTIPKWFDKNEKIYLFSPIFYFLMMKRIASILTIFGTVLSSLYGQVDSPALYNDAAIFKEDSSKLLFSFYNLNFLKNNEYFGKIATGYTLFGSQLNPKIAWVPNAHMRIEGGIYIRKDFGNPSFTTIAPTLTFKLQNNGYAFLFGNLEGSVSHRLIEPLYNYERLITNRLENGLQFKVDKKALWFDSWIDWERQEYQNSPFQEIITAGLSSKLTLLEASKTNFFSVKIPFQAIVSHHGGQIDIDTTALQTLANTATGISMELDMSEKNGFLKSISSDNYYVYYRDLSPSKRQPYISGNGTYLNLLLKSRPGINLMISYWNGNYFMAPRGGYLYQSLTSLPWQNGYTKDNRKLLIVRLMYQKEIYPGLLADVRLEPYEDVNNHFVEYSYSVYLSYKIDAPFRKTKTQ